MKRISRKQFLQQSALGFGSVMLFSGFDFDSAKARYKVITRDNLSSGRYRRLFQDL